MASILTHPAIAFATIPLLQGIGKKPLVIFAGVVLTVLPDIDVFAFSFGIPYEHVLGHRGLSHSIFFSLVLSIVLLLFFRQPSWTKNVLLWLYFTICGISHGLLDAMTNGGRGVGFLIPFSSQRFFFDFQPLQVSTLNFERFFSVHGLRVLKLELIYVWLPAILFFFATNAIMHLIKAQDTDKISNTRVD